MKTEDAPQKKEPEYTPSGMYANCIDSPKNGGKCSHGGSCDGCKKFIPLHNFVAGDLAKILESRIRREEKDKLAEALEFVLRCHNKLISDKTMFVEDIKKLLKEVKK